MHKEDEKCVIQRAKLSCWRRKLLSSSRIEEGEYTCWLFVVQYDNVTTIAQHSRVSDFPAEKDGCSSEQSCGMESWPCRVGNVPTTVNLRWSYPLKPVLYCVVGIAITFLSALHAIWRFFSIGRTIKEVEEDFDDDDLEAASGKGNEVPFTAKRRLPTWMTYGRSCSVREPERVAR